MHQMPQAEEEEPRPGTEANCEASPAENDETLLSDEVFESAPSQRLLNLADSVRRLAGNFSSNAQPDDEWVSTSSESGTPVSTR